jgi:very-short-patch-repair endonuclease
MPVRLNKHQFDQLNLQNADVLELNPTKRKRPHKPSAAQPPQRDRADILAIWLERHGIACITEVEYQARMQRGERVQNTLVREFHFARPWREYRADFCLPHPFGGLIVEVDGGNKMIRYDRNGNPYAAGHHIDDSDYVKTNFACTLGYRRLAFTTNMLENDPLGCVKTVKAVLRGELPPL